ncbi:unnamed protein product [Darwinula stevensoni]|uniref:Uncharacterized protein n=1 Tax=Darwinula stevensoni TaxID=69355 RepID=A0A7R9A8A7_9CRUS|nr:unnamed protein product [Darwinula stevensoni]CAG0896218.1 unnamed protein product [Darwinula stevensoni]
MSELLKWGTSTVKSLNPVNWGFWSYDRCSHYDPQTRGKKSFAPSSLNVGEVGGYPGFLHRLMGSSRGIMVLAGLSGATAVMLGAYGAHVFLQKRGTTDEKRIVFETANRYHFLHSIALLAVPLCRRPGITAGLMASGMAIFCGTCYIYAFTNWNSVRNITPYGGVLLILAWLSVML